MLHRIGLLVLCCVAEGFWYTLFLKYFVVSSFSLLHTFLQKKLSLKILVECIEYILFETTNALLVCKPMDVSHTTYGMIMKACFDFWP